MFPNVQYAALVISKIQPALSWSPLSVGACMIQLLAEWYRFCYSAHTRKARPSLCGSGAAVSTAT